MGLVNIFIFESCFLAAEIIKGVVVETCCKHSVGDGLGIDVGKSLGCDVVDEDVFEAGHLVLEGAVFAVGLVTGEGFFDNVGKETGFAGHHLCQFL